MNLISSRFPNGSLTPSSGWSLSSEFYSSPNILGLIFVSSAMGVGIQAVGQEEGAPMLGLFRSLLKVRVKL